MTVDDVPHIARRYLNKFGLTQQGWTFQWDHAKSRAGSCHYARKVISLSKHYVSFNVSDRLDNIVDTILHEIAHAIAGSRAGHGPKWKRVCLAVGAQPTRCYDPTTVAMPKGRYTATCGKCGKQFSRYKQVRRDGWYYCTKCGPQNGRLTFQDTTMSAISITTVTPILDRIPHSLLLKGWNETMPVSKKANSGIVLTIRTPQARVLAALMPTNPLLPITEWPLVTRAQMRIACGLSPTNSMNRILHGIKNGSNRHLGLVEAGMLEEVVLDIDGVSEANYRITITGVKYCLSQKANDEINDRR